MAAQAVKSIAQYAVMKWMQQEGFAMERFKVEFVSDDKAVITDAAGEQLKVVYDSTTKTVYAVEG